MPFFSWHDSMKKVHVRPSPLFLFSRRDSIFFFDAVHWIACCDFFPNCALCGALLLAHLLKKKETTVRENARLGNFGGDRRKFCFFLYSVPASTVGYRDPFSVSLRSRLRYRVTHAVQLLFSSFFGSSVTSRFSSAPFSRDGFQSCKQGPALFNAIMFPFSLSPFYRPF